MANPYQDADEIDPLFDGDGDFHNGDDVSQLADDNTPMDTSFAPGNEDNDLGAFLAEGGDGVGNFNFDELNNRELDIGDKADDAQDFEDISDDDLPDEEMATGGAVQQPSTVLPGIENAAMEVFDFSNADGDDDLFGGPSSPPATDDGIFALPTKPASAFTNGDQRPESPDLASEHSGSSPGDLQSRQNNEPGMSEKEMSDWRVQMALFSGEHVPVPETKEENLAKWVKLEFPQYTHGDIPFFNQLFPPKPATFKDNDAKYPVKAPKPIRPTKVTLEIEKDQRALFNSAATSTVTEFRKGLVRCELAQAAQDEEFESSDESDLDEPLPGGITMQDLEFLCTDFDSLSAFAVSEADLDDLHARAAASDMEMFGLDDFNDFEQPRKKRRTGRSAHEIVSIHQLDLPSFNDPERETAKLSGKVVLDMNDPDLLVEELDPDVVRIKARPGDKARGTGTLKAQLGGKFKLSNDAEYDLLKQNHQHKVRGQLSHLNVEHSLPAIRLQYPYYKVKPDISELRNFHRKRMLFKHPITFSKPNMHKRKHFKGKATKDIFVETKDLSVGDNSTAILLEYTEEHPIMLTQTGMGSKIVNYYRKRAADDTTRPKYKLGETQVLLLEDKSPFYNIGHVDPGEEATALYNSMYRAPLFEQDPSLQDFLVVREKTGMSGEHYYIRKADNVFVVGQELPSAQVPGTHSRMVTTASKNRLKAISFRIARRKKSHRIRVEDVTKHFPDTTDMQNRQKMKEFMKFSKEAKEWEMQNGEEIPDEEAIQALLKPEDVCLLESMYVGDQYLQDAGFADEDDEDKDNDDGSLEQRMAPWRLTKNFQQAIQEKAHLRVYGDGDPSGRGEAMSLLKISMKGGFKAVGGPAVPSDQLKKELGGHSYNVAMQQKLYEESKRRVWDKQKEALSSKIEPTDLDAEGDVDAREDARARGSVRATPVGTPAGRRRDDETGTSFSKRSATSQTQKFLKIKRTYLDKDGNKKEDIYVENDPLVIKAYQRRRGERNNEYAHCPFSCEHQLTYLGSSYYSDSNLPAIRKLMTSTRRSKTLPLFASTIMLTFYRLEIALAAAEARKANAPKRRKKNKMDATAGSPDGDAGSQSGEAGSLAAGGREPKATQRKCANCGQVGHIKTNKKLVDRKCYYCKLPIDRKVVSGFMAASGATNLNTGWRD